MCAPGLSVRAERRPGARGRHPLRAVLPEEVVQPDGRAPRAARSVGPRVSREESSQSPGSVLY